MPGHCGASPLVNATKRSPSIAGYRNPVITLKFNELVEDGDTCHVIIRNPKTLPGSQLSAMFAGQDTAADEDKLRRVNEMLAGLVVGWRVYDATVPVKADPETGELIHDEETEPRLLPLPATAELVARVPQVVQIAMMNEVTGAVAPPQNQADGTSKTS